MPSCFGCYFNFIFVFCFSYRTSIEWAEWTEWDHEDDLVAAIAAAAGYRHAIIITMYQNVSFTVLTRVSFLTSTTMTHEDDDDDNGDDASISC